MGCLCAVTSYVISASSTRNIGTVPGTLAKWRDQNAQKRAEKLLILNFFNNVLVHMA